MTDTGAPASGDNQGGNEAQTSGNATNANLTYTGGTSVPYTTGGFFQTTTTNPGGQPSQQSADEKKFDQAQVDRFNTKARNEAAQAEQKRISEELGVSIEDAKKLIADAKKAEDQKKSEIDKLREANENLKKESETNVTNAQREAHADRIKFQLVRAGVQLPEDTPEAPDASDRALERIVGLVSVPIGASVDDIRQNISELKSEFATLFTPPPPKEDPNANKGNPPSNVTGAPRKAQTKGPDGKAMGEEIALQRMRQTGRAPLTTP